MEPRRCVPAHVALEDSTVGLPQVHYHYPVENVGEFPIDIEAYELAADLRVLPQEDW